MVIHGHIENGVVVLEGGVSLPEGAAVTVLCSLIISQQQDESSRERIQFPLVRSKQPGTLHLTGRQIAEILDDEDASA